MKDFLYRNGETIGQLIVIIIIIVVCIFLMVKAINDCDKKGGTLVRGYCVSNEVIK